MTRNEYIDPRTPREWQEAVDAAKGALTVDAARLYGLIATTLQVNVARCQEILERGEEMGIIPREDAIERYTRELLRQPHAVDLFRPKG